jgi:release factor glutamine methyltransferase
MKVIAEQVHTLRQTLLQDASRLTKSLILTSDSARIEIQCLLQHVTGVSRAWLLAHPENCLDGLAQLRYSNLLERRLQGEPIAYLLGEREFYGLSLKVTPATLIPRPETELLVELVLRHISRDDPCSRFLDLGTGSGAVALAIAHACQNADVLGCDISNEALGIARINAENLAITNAHFMHSNWFEALTGRGFNAIVSNPPYIASSDPHLTQGDIRFEPKSALISGEDGLHDIRHIVANARTHLEPGGWLLLEHGHKQAPQVRELLWRAGFNTILSERDLAGIERVSGGRIV